MRVFAQKQNQPQQKSSATPTRSNRSAPAPRHEAKPLLHLQRTIGNQAVLRLLRASANRLEASSDNEASATPYIHSETSTTTRFAHDFSRIPAHAKAPITIQPKLTVNTPGDIYEQEADHLAEHVMRMPDPKVQRACACGDECSKCQTEQPSQKHQRLQTKHGSSNAEQTTAPPIVHEVLASPGQPLDASPRAFFEPRFGHDFSTVRVHTEASAAASAQAVNSLAYTVGTHIVFNSGQYEPTASNGQSLLAHELTHVVQQSSSGSMTAQPFTIGPANNPAEREADAIAAAVAADAQMPLISRTSAAQLHRSAISNNERFLDLEPCNELACIDKYSCEDDTNGVECPDGTTNAFSKKNHKFSRHVRCDPECNKGITPCSDSNQELALPKKRFSMSKCDQTLTLCANGKSTTATVREESNKNSWEATRAVAAALDAGPDLHASIYPEPNDPDIKDDRKCTPKPTPKAAPKRAAGEEK